MQDQNYRWQLVGKKLAGNATDEEIRQLQEVLNEEPYLTALMMDLNHLWGEPYGASVQEIKKIKTSH